MRARVSVVETLALFLYPPSSQFPRRPLLGSWANRGNPPSTRRKHFRDVPSEKLYTLVHSLPVLLIHDRGQHHLCRRSSRCTTTRLFAINL